ncbi:protein NRT1/ PTR FAMILY 1.2-like [Salvia miltiorrhiza]|uniref:protein NRT1/ PTR FAMILY 1.2-like n=1 Tax=Salvia miltiorrhiza TaxID=226208 RepID=UPI0025AC18EE|nr:protein NRT1/ PTR FAMILY 1.2-like [Salvia miltiorrhiza]
MENSEAPKVSEKGERRKGGLITMPFIIANEAFEKIAAYGLMPNMILYLVGSYHFSVAGGTNTLFIWSAISNFMPVLGAFISDSYFGRFLVISVGTATVLLGLIALWLTAIIHEARPLPCDPQIGKCMKPNAGQYAFLFTAFALLSIGAGGVRPCSLAFGADQYDNPENPNNQRVLLTFFNWYYASVGVSLMVALTVVVYIQNEFGWVIGFGVPVALMLFACLMFFLGSKLYVKVKPHKSLLTGLAQVLVAAWKNRRLPLPSQDSDKYYQTKGSKIMEPSQKFRLLNKACILSNPEKEVNADGSASDPWRLCSVLQVEVLKSLIDLLPVWSAGIMIAVLINQHSFPVIQALTLDRRLAGNFKIPPGSFGIFSVIALTLWVVLYDRAIVPQISKYTNNPRGIGVRARIGAGLFISCIATATAALVERKRRAAALQQGLADHPKQQVDMTAMWLVPQHALTGLSEGLNAIGQIELYYSQFPKSMASIAVALFSLTLAVGNLAGSVIVSVVDSASRRGGGESWVADNVNRGHYDYYYWVLTILSVVNLIYFILCSRFYKCFENERVWDLDAVELHDKPHTSTYLSA